ncbi:MAG: DUF1003 domain-containing protein [bacterium]
MPLKTRKKIRQISFMDKAGEILALWVGSWSFFWLHIIWFFLWLWLSLDINTLTLIVSLEAILLMTVLLMQSNRQAAKDNIRDEADYRADLSSEQEIKEVKKQLEEIKDKLKEINSNNN